MMAMMDLPPLCAAPLCVHGLSERALKESLKRSVGAAMYTKIRYKATSGEGTGCAARRVGAH